MELGNSRGVVYLSLAEWGVLVRVDPRFSLVSAAFEIDSGMQNGITTVSIINC